VNGVLDDREQRAKLLLLAAEVVRGQQPEGDDLDAGLLAPLEQLEDLVGALAVPLADVGMPRGPGPAPVAVAHHADVPGHRLPRKVALQPALVQPVAQVAVSHEPTFLAAERAQEPNANLFTFTALSRQTSARRGRDEKVRSMPRYPTGDS